MVGALQHPLVVRGRADPMTIRSKLATLRRRAEKALGQSRPVILMYHRVADLDSDPWDLAVSPVRFEEQMRALRDVRRVAPLDDLRRRPGDKPVVAITFDDGYRDVATAARPILERHDCPATLFLATGAIGRDQEFWWDRLARIVLETPIVGDLDVRVANEDRTWRLGRHTTHPELLEAHLQMWTALRPLGETERSQQLERLASLFGAETAARPSHRIMSAEDVSALAGGPIEVGAHTVSHPRLPDLDADAQWQEISDSRRQCELLTGRAPTSFAYPFGEYDETAVALVREAGFDRAVTVEPGVVTRGTDPLRLPRLGVGDWDAETLLRNLP
jgi:peptidoglycan/xylan/chitin deacetylase (PgdA/CDA1 family)